MLEAVAFNKEMFQLELGNDTTLDVSHTNIIEIIHRPGTVLDLDEVWSERYLETFDTRSVDLT